jgi:hypothetical protein
MANEKTTVRLCGKEQAAVIANPMMFRPLIWCTACAHLVRMVTPEAATMVSRTDMQQLNHRIENHSLHSIKTQSGSVFICLTSLTQIS